MFPMMIDNQNHSLTCFLKSVIQDLEKNFALNLFDQAQYSDKLSPLRSRDSRLSLPVISCLNTSLFEKKDNKSLALSVEFSHQDKS